MRWKVVIIESERGWGKSVDEVKYFDNEEEAWQHYRSVNLKNNLDYVPSVYWYACKPEKVE